jgi:aldehyde dehydrogenase (NAD+)
LSNSYHGILQQAGLAAVSGSAAAAAPGSLEVHTPIDGTLLARVPMDSSSAVAAKIQASAEAFLRWREVPGPQRGELLRRFALRVRTDKQALGKLISLEAGKILSEGLGEVQEVIDICDFAVGLSRQIYGLTIASERPGHHLLERWQPLGPVGVISAFNFPMAVWAWNAALALVCGDTVIWKPSEKTPLSAMALHRLMAETVAEFPGAPAAISQLIIGKRDIGEQLADSELVPLVSATGSTAMGRALGPRVAARFGRSLLELGGNNAAIVTPTADLNLTLRAVVFAAAGTAGQRCTTLRRLFVHRSLCARLREMLRKSYASLAIGSPLEAGTLIGPLIDAASYERMQATLAAAKAQGATVIGGERATPAGVGGGFYVRPALVEADQPLAVMSDETFAPILYVVPYDAFSDALQMQNGVRQGLSSAIFTNDMREAETFLSATGSDCGIANVNTGPSGAEIGGAFGGEKETGGGRESGSDAWKAYMRRQTQTVNYSSAVQLAQGVEFPVD